MWVALFVVVIVAVALATLVMISFCRWRLRAYERVRSGSEVAETAMGPVEYALDGAGPVVMVLHGGAGGFDQGRVLAGDLGLPESFTVIAPSRAGYLRTPLSTCATPEETADAFAALLDVLEVPEAAVVGISGGGPTALQMALRHPQRVSALVMIVAVSGPFELPARSTGGVARLFFSNAGMWVVDFLCWLAFIQTARWRPGLVAWWLLKATEDLDDRVIRERVRGILRDQRQVDWMRMLMEFMLPVSLRKVGLDNDLRQLAGAPDYPLERIACPTLSVYARHDGNVLPEHGERVARGVPGAEAYVVEGCGHLVWLSEHAGDIRSTVCGFLERHAAKTAVAPDP